MRRRIRPRSSWTSTAPGGERIPAPAEWWLHHTAGPKPIGGASATLAREEKLIRATRAYHVQGRGFQDIAYSWGEMPSERLYDLRGPFRSGGHTRGRNHVSYAVVIFGEYHTRDTVTRGMVQAIRYLVWKATVEEWVQPGTYPTGGHRQAPEAATSCPGDRAMAKLAKMREPYEPPRSFTIRKPNGEVVQRSGEKTEELVARFLKRMDVGTRFKVRRIR